MEFINKHGRGGCAGCRLWQAIVLILYAAVPANCQQPGQEKAPVSDFFNFLNEEEIVISAARREQPAAQAPAIVTVVSAEEIRNRGYRNLDDVLRDAVGFDINDNLHWPDTGVRGINPLTSYGEKILMLLDGHNMVWRQFNRNYHNASWVSMDDVERIEIIRGPGSALWGQGAVLGVVNIITKNPREPGKNEIYSRAGMGKHKSYGTRVGRTFEDAGFHLSYSRSDEDQAKNLAPVKEFQKLGKGAVYNPTTRAITDNLYLRGAYKNLYLNAQYGRYDPLAPLSSFSNVGGDDSRFVTDRYFGVLGLDKDFSDRFHLNLYAAYDDYRFDPGAQYEKNPYNDAAVTGSSTTLTDPVAQVTGKRFIDKMAAGDRRYEAGAKLGIVLDNLKFMTGAEYEYTDIVRWHFPEEWVAGKLPFPRFISGIYGLYGQLEYKLGPAKATVGTRYDADRRFGSVWSPSAGVVCDLPLGFYAKALYGEAYHAPSIHDLYYFRKNGFYGNPDIRPEFSKDYEAQFGYTLPGSLRAELAYFSTEISGLIRYSDTRPAGTPLSGAGAFPSSQLPTAPYKQKTNQGKAITDGWELTLTSQLTRKLGMSLHGSLRDPRDENGNRLPLTARNTAGISLNFQPVRDWNLNWSGSYVGRRVVAPAAYSDGGAPATWTAATDPTLDADAYFVANAAGVWRPQRWEGVEAGLRVQNMFNADYYDAASTILYPRPKLTARIWLSYRF